jgi:FdrA protein
MLAHCDAQGAVVGRSILGLYTGGTLASETTLILAAVLGEVDDVLPGEASGQTGRIGAHHVVDLGDDQFTIGQPHPMLAPETRAARLVAAGGDPTLGVVLLDCVLGLVSHRDPTAALIAAITAVRAAAAHAGHLCTSSLP